jgi:phosphatidylglycerophosphate synthase
MNDNAVALLDKIADKLGVTAQYLWSVMLKQAPVYITTTLIEYAILLVVIVLVLRFRKTIGKWMFEVGDAGDGLVAMFGSLIIVISGVIWLLVALFSFHHLITAIFNPEYWALEQLLDVLKKK